MYSRNKSVDAYGNSIFHKSNDYIKGYQEELGRLHAREAYQRELEFREIWEQQQESWARAKKIEDGLRNGQYVCARGNIIIDVVTGEPV